MATASTQLEIDVVAGRWERLISLHNPKVLTALLARGVRLQQAREVCHEAWSRLFEQFKAGNLGTIELPGLAIAQAWFLISMEARKSQTRQRERPLHLDPGVIGIADPCATAEERLASKELLARAAAALSECGERARSVFLAAYRNPEIPHAELASRLGMSVQRYRQSLCEVRARLRRALEEAAHE